jgi:hypothetical protein
MTDNLPQKLTLSQLQGVSKDLASQGAPRETVQGFVDNYKTDGTGGYILKTAQPEQPTPESQGAIKQADGTYKAPSFLEGLKQAAIGAGNYFGSEAVGLGKVVLNALKPSSNTFLPQNRDANKNVAKDVPYNQAIQVGTDLQNQMSPQNQAQQGGATAAKVAEIALPLAKPVARVIENSPSIIKGGVEAISKLIAGKTEQEILATAPEDVFKLPKAQRDIWFADQGKQIQTQTENITQQAKNNLLKQTEQTNLAADNLNKELKLASNTKVNEIRPKIVQTMGEQSKQYRSLVDEAMAGKEDITVNKTQLSSFIDASSDNPEIAAQIKAKLQISGIGKGKTTLGDIYDGIKSLKQDMSSAGAKGTRIFSADDVMTDKAVKILTDYMQSKGVDFVDARKFWAQYAPVRDQWISDFKPFNQAGTKTGTGASVLITDAKGVDPKNSIFIKSTEKLLGEPINVENKAILEKMSVNEKTAVANKLAADEKIATADVAKQIAEGKLSSQQIEVGRQARLRDTIKWTIKGVAAGLTGVELDKFVKKYTGIGF